MAYKNPFCIFLIVTMVLVAGNLATKNKDAGKEKKCLLCCSKLIERSLGQISQAEELTEVEFYQKITTDIQECNRFILGSPNRQETPLEVEAPIYLHYFQNLLNMAKEEDEGAELLIKSEIQNLRKVLLERESKVSDLNAKVLQSYKGVVGDERYERNLRNSQQNKQAIEDLKNEIRKNEEKLRAIKAIRKHETGLKGKGKKTKRMEASKQQNELKSVQEFLEKVKNEEKKETGKTRSLNIQEQF